MLPSCVSDDKLSSYLDISAVCIHLYLIMTDVSPICSELLELMIYGKAIRSAALEKKRWYYLPCTTKPKENQIQNNKTVKVFPFPICPCLEK